MNGYGKCSEGILKDILQEALLVHRGVTYKIAGTCQEMRGQGKVRAQVYVEIGSFQPDQLHRNGDLIERDIYDERSVHIIAIINDEIVGTTRLILGEPLLMEAGYSDSDEPTFTLPPIDRSRTAELSRLSILPTWRRRLDISLGLILSSVRCSTEIGIETWVAAVNLPVFRLYSQVGFAMNIIGDPQVYHGIVAVPIQVEVKKAVSWLRFTNPQMYEFFRGSVPEIDASRKEWESVYKENVAFIKANIMQKERQSV